MNIRDICWPIYAIGTDHIITEDTNVTYVEHSGKISILDNKNLAGDTLGKRRLLLDKKELYHTKRTLFMFAELIDYTRDKITIDRKFIDSKGLVFSYKKHSRRKLIWRRVRSIETFNTYTLLKVQGLRDIFEIPNNYWVSFKNRDDIYLGLLDFEKYYMIYDIDIVLRKDTWRKV